MEKGYSIEDLRVYNASMELGQLVWNEVEGWDMPAKINMGSQLIRSADSVAANISEGWGRSFLKEQKQFYFFARGSLCETKTWLTKASERGLLKLNSFEKYCELITSIEKMLNKLISTLKSRIG